MNRHAGCCMSERRRQADQIEGLPTAIAKSTVPSQTYKCAAPLSTLLNANISRSALPLRLEWSDALGLCRARSGPSSHASPAHAVPAGRALSDDRSAPSALACVARAGTGQACDWNVSTTGSPEEILSSPGSSRRRGSTVTSSRADRASAGRRRAAWDRDTDPRRSRIPL